MSRHFVVYDERAMLDPDSADELEVCSTVKDAIKAVRNWGAAGVLFDGGGNHIGWCGHLATLSNKELKRIVEEAAR